MAAAKGNKYAEKWTEETVLYKIADIHKYNRSHRNNYHLGLSIIEQDLSPQWWSQMAKKFNDNAKVLEAIKKVESYLEARIINSTISGEAKSAAMAIFYLKNKHGYKDKTEQEVKMDASIQSKDIEFE